MVHFKKGRTVNELVDAANAETGCNAKGGRDTPESNGIELNVLAHVLGNVAHTADICSAVDDGMETKPVVVSHRELFLFGGIVRVLADEEVDNGDSTESDEEG